MKNTKTFEDIEGWFDFDDIYSKMINQHGDWDSPSHFVEVGSFVGKSAAFMASNIKRLHKNIRFDCVDIWQFSSDDPNYSTHIGRIGDIYYKFLKNMIDCDCLDAIKPIKFDSVIASTLYQDESLDFVFIDANHAYDFVKKDIEVWFPKVKKGGYLGGHDYTNYPSVKIAVDEKFSEKTLTNASWLVKK